MPRVKDASSRGGVANIHFLEVVGPLERNKATNRTVLGRLAGLEQHRGKLLKCSWDTQPGEDWAAGKCSRAKSGRVPPSSIRWSLHLMLYGDTLLPHRDFKTRWVFASHANGRTDRNDLPQWVLAMVVSGPLHSSEFLFRWAEV